MVVPYFTLIAALYALIVGTDWLDTMRDVSEGVADNCCQKSSSLGYFKNLTSVTAASDVFE